MGKMGTEFAVYIHIHNIHTHIPRTVTTDHQFTIVVTAVTTATAVYPWCNNELKQVQQHCYRCNNTVTACFQSCVSCREPLQWQLVTLSSDTCFTTAVAAVYSSKSGCFHSCDSCFQSSESRFNSSDRCFHSSKNGFYCYNNISTYATSMTT